MSKRILLCLDGTWNQLEAAEKITNVVRLSKATPSVGADGKAQLVHYIPGVGTSKGSEQVGGATGLGVSKRIMQGYEFLCENYQDGDEIYITGFSRGAFTACALADMICHMGLRKKADIQDVQVGSVFMAYLARHTMADEISRTKARWTGELATPDIHFLGVWDSVGALGVSDAVGEIIFGAEKGALMTQVLEGLYSTKVHPKVKHARHAVAIHENRFDFKPTLWDNDPAPGQDVKQVWFAGAHSNVGGGYEDHLLSDISLQWIMDEAQACGLTVDAAQKPTIGPAAYQSIPVDSYQQFMGGHYQQISKRHYRRIGSVNKMTESMHPSVDEWLKGASGRSLAEYL